MIIALDGPSGAGKSTVAKAVAQKLGFACLDTGAMYRSIAWGVLEAGEDVSDPAACERVARERVISFRCEPGQTQPRLVFLDDVEVTSEIRTARIDRAVSPVSSHPGVRAALVDQQRRIGAEGDFVVEGRDIGSVVFPDAEVKVFLTASDEERAHRRVRQNADRGIGSIDYEEVLRDIRRRDQIDSERAASPLVIAPGAIVIDSTRAYIEEVIDHICTIARERKGL